MLGTQDPVLHPLKLVCGGPWPRGPWAEHRAGLDLQACPRVFWAGKDSGSVNSPGATPRPLDSNSTPPGCPRATLTFHRLSARLPVGQSPRPARPAGDRDLTPPPPRWGRQPSEGGGGAGRTYVQNHEHRRLHCRGATEGQDEPHGAPDPEADEDDRDEDQLLIGRGGAALELVCPGHEGPVLGESLMLREEHVKQM